MLSKHSLHPIPLAPAWTAVAVMVSTTRTQSAKRPAAKRPAKGPVAKRRPSKLSALGGPLLTESDGSGSDSDRSGGDSDPSVHRSDSSCLSQTHADLPHLGELIAVAVNRSQAYCAFCGHRWMTSAGRHNLFCQMDGQGPLCAIHRHRCRRVEGQPTETVPAMNMLLCPDCVGTLCRCDARDGAVAATMNMLLPG